MEKSGKEEKQKKRFIACLCHKGAHGGAICLLGGRMVYVTRKLTLSANYKRIEMRIADIKSLSRCRSLGVFPALKICLKNGSDYKFIVFCPKKLLAAISGKAGL